MGFSNDKPMTAQKPPRTRVVIIVDEETGELDYFVMQSGAEIIVIEEPRIALGIYEATRRVH